LECDELQPFVVVVCGGCVGHFGSLGSEGMLFGSDRNFFLFAASAEKPKALKDGESRDTQGKYVTNWAKGSKR
jgi:hypothetical protein